MSDASIGSKEEWKFIEWTHHTQSVLRTEKNYRLFGVALPWVSIEITQDMSMSSSKEDWVMEARSIAQGVMEDLQAGRCVKVLITNYAVVFQLKAEGELH